MSSHLPTFKPVTPTQVLETLAANRESEEPDAILAVLKAHDGKQLTVRLLDKLPGGSERWHISKSAGMTHLTEWRYTRTGGREGMSFLMAYSTTSVVIDAAWVEEHATCYFSARRERNAKRDRVLTGPDRDTIADVMSTRINAVLTARMRLEHALQELGEWTGYDKLLSPDQYVWEALAGAKKDR